MRKRVKGVSKLLVVPDQAVEKANLRNKTRFFSVLLLWAYKKILKMKEFNKRTLLFGQTVRRSMQPVTWGCEKALLD